MSQENVEVAKEFTRRFEGGDRGDWRDYFDPKEALKAAGLSE